MGYSCRADASDTLTVICKMFAKGRSSNVLTIKGSEYFFERGKEQPDGAITGSLYKMLPDDRAHKSGGFRIEGDGTIAKFPGLTKTDRKEAESTMRDMQARNPHLLHAWGRGKF